MSGKLFAAAVACGIASVGCTDGGPRGEEFTAPRGGFVPEGVEYDRVNQRLLVGSLTEGTIFVFGRDGTVTPFIADPEIASSVGIEVDEERERLLVAGADYAVFKHGNVGQAKLAAYDLTTGERLALVDLAAAIQTSSDSPSYFANDVAVDADGNAYLTDSRMSVVYKVTMDYQASVLHRFTGLPRGVALNGIEYHPDGYLLVVADDRMFKVPVADPAGTTLVNVSDPVDGEDGIVWASDGTLAVTSNSDEQVVKLRSTDGWATAQRVAVASLRGQVTTAASVGDEIYVLHPHFSDDDPPSIEQAIFVKL
jgi:sugar lactone lactonase YvrE